ncbi:hypothetical protein PLICRDRAFT_43460 [Plicaturopsis crispa FD-325 SS-3]|nr:hypothetical protein PLICRDRAFT_43460 [Plicaturopsis crispa FD-325 SS-3]
MLAATCRHTPRRRLVHGPFAAAAARAYASEPAPHDPAPHDPAPPPPPPSKHPTQPRASRLYPHPAPRPVPSSHPRQVLPSLPPTFGRNQQLPVSSTTRALLESIVAQFDAPIRYAFAYGSGVFEQDGYKVPQAPGEKAPMLDFMFAVTHPAHWHSINMQQHPSHYPLHARALGSGFVSGVQEIAPGVWFNTLVQMNGVTIKYGVTTVDNLCSDLLNWRSLYLAGRMHKPLRIIKDDARVRLTQQVNLASALRASLLTLPSSFPPSELFTRIAGFSYAGDPRMLLPAENRGKVANIVRGQEAQFAELYWRLARGLPGVNWRSQGASVIEQDNSAHARAAHLRKLPSNLLARVRARYEIAGGATGSAEESAYWAGMASDERLPEILQEEMSRIVRGPATVQTLKGVVSAGVGKSARYTLEKVGKWWRGPSAS